MLIIRKTIVIRYSLLLQSSGLFSKNESWTQAGRSLLRTQVREEKGSLKKKVQVSISNSKQSNLKSFGIKAIFYLHPSL